MKSETELPHAYLAGVRPKWVAATLTGLDEGRLVRQIVCWSLRLGALAGVVYAIWAAGRVLPELAEMYAGHKAVTYLPLVGVVVVATLAAVVVVSRSRTVLARGFAPYAAAPLACTLLRTCGEASAAMFLGVGLLGAAYTLVTGACPACFLAGFRWFVVMPGAGNSVVGAVVFLAANVGAGLAVLFATYLAAEIVATLIATARRVAGFSNAEPSLVSIPDHNSVGVMERLDSEPQRRASLPAAGFCTRCGARRSSEGACLACATN